MLIHRLQFMKEDYKEDLTIYQQQLSQVLQSLAPSFQNPRYTHARDPNERNKKLLKKVSQVISGYLTRFGKSYVHLVFLLQKFFSMGAPTNNGARGPPRAKSGPAQTVNQLQNKVKSNVRIEGIIKMKVVQLHESTSNQLLNPTPTPKIARQGPQN